MKNLILLSTAFLAITSLAKADSVQICQKEDARKLAYSLIQSNLSTNIPGMLEMKVLSLAGSITDKSDSTTTDENGIEVRKFFYYATVLTKHDQSQPVQERMVGYVQVGTEKGQCAIQAIEGSSVVSVDLEGTEAVRTPTKSKK